MKKTIAILLAIIMMFSAVNVSVFALVPDESEKSIEELFALDSSTFDIDFAIKSISIAHAAFGKKDVSIFEETDDDICELLTSYGFDYKTYNYDAQSDVDSVACAVGKKQVVINGEKTTILLVAIRGGEYKTEWAGNFNIGDTSDVEHTGFRIAKEKLLGFVDQYLTENEVGENVKLWTTGYSRGGGISNLFAANVIDVDDTYPAIKALNLSSENVYAYTFEAPRGTTNENANDSTYDYIHNIINPTDIVPKVAPICFGFKRYGVDMILPSAENTYNYNEYLELVRAEFKELEGKYYDGNFRTVSNLCNSDFINSLPTANLDFSEFSLGSFLDYYINEVGVKDRVNNDRDYYAENLQDFLRLIFGSIMGSRTDLIKEYMNDLGAEIKTFVQENAKILDIEKIINSDDFNQEIENLIDSFIEYNTEAAFEVMEKTGSNFEGVVSFLLGTLVYNLDYLLTIIVNIDNIAYAHFPELTIGWLHVAKETNYFDNNHSQYKDVKIIGDCDIEVFDSENKLAASIVGGYPQAISSSSIAYSVDRDGMKSIQLPLDEQFTANITVNSDGKFNYSIKTMDQSSFTCVDEIANVIDVNAGDKITITAFDADTTLGGTEVTIDQIGEGGTNSCDCICHKDGVFDIIYEVIYYIWNFFGVNKYCKCGATHY